MVVGTNPFVGKFAVVAGRRLELGLCRPLAHTRDKRAWLFWDAAAQCYFLVSAKRPGPERVILLSCLDAYDFYTQMARKLATEREAFPPGRLPPPPPRRWASVVYYDGRPDGRTGSRWPRPEMTVELGEPPRTYAIRDCVLLAHDYDYPVSRGRPQFLFRAPDGDYFLLRIGKSVQARLLRPELAAACWERLPSKVTPPEKAFPRLAVAAGGGLDSRGAPEQP